MINYFIAVYHCKIHARIQVAEVDGIGTFLELPSKYKLPHRIEDVDSGVSCRAVDGESSLIWVRTFRPYRDNMLVRHHPNTKVGLYAARPAFFWRFSPLRSEAEWERSGRRLDAEIALV